MAWAWTCPYAWVSPGSSLGIKPMLKPRITQKPTFNPRIVQSFGLGQGFGQGLGLSQELVLDIGQ